MADNKALANAKNVKFDEFFTQITEIEKEMKYYKQHFKGKTIFCNCDDPEYSNFWRYFQLNFYEFGLKKLISTHYTKEAPSYKMEIIATDQKQQIGIPEYVKTPLQGNGDFRSEECIEILKEADIVITNPPFSLIREYIAQLLKYDKKFIIVANSNALHAKEIFPLIKDGVLWLGNRTLSGGMDMIVPDSVFDEGKVKKYKVNQYGEKIVNVQGICWLTNLDIAKRHEDILLYRTYTPEEYPNYINFDGIDVDDVRDIPMDYYGYMGVPDSFLQHHNKEQFTIIGLGCGNLAKQIGVKKNHRGRTDIAYLENGKPKCPYSRIIIKRKVSDTE